MIEPHGGTLVSCKVEENKDLMSEWESLRKVVLSEREETDLMMFADGALSPLNGFMTQKCYEDVVHVMHLPNGIPWTMPITLQISNELAGQIKVGDRVALATKDTDCIVAAMEVQDIFDIDPKVEAEKVYGTTDAAHPSVAYLNSRNTKAIGGPVEVMRYQYRFIEFPETYKSPTELRATFEKLGWKSTVAFQTRNPIHRAHEYLQKCALEMVDGLLIHPLMGATKADDIPGNVRMQCYQALMEGYYPKDRVQLSIFPAYMRYGGPREAIFHALVRKNYGCTHIIIGRDHAGVGNYYGTFDAQKIFDEFDPEKLGITPLKFEHSFFCKRCGNMGSTKTCPHGKDDHVFLSGTKVREMLNEGKEPPVEFTRPEVAKILVENARG